MKNKESWVFTAWRPAIARSYLLICVFDFLIGPIVSPIYQSLFYPGQEFVPWKPNTLAEGGLYHMAMLTIVGVTAWGRTQEKLKFMNMFGEEMEVEKNTHTMESTEEENPLTKPLRKTRSRRRRR